MRSFMKLEKLVNLLNIKCLSTFYILDQLVMYIIFEYVNLKCYEFCLGCNLNILNAGLKNVEK